MTQLERDPAGRFLKGHIPWVKGKHLGPQHRTKISQGLIGRHLPRETKEKISQKMVKKVDLSPTRKLGYFCGLIIGDGYLAKTKSRNHWLVVETTREEMREIAIRAIESLGLRAYSRERIKTRRFPNGSIYNNLNYYIRTDSKMLYDALRTFKQGGHRWNIPSFLTTEESLLGFLQGIFDAEGSVDRNGRVITFYSKHLENVEQIRNALKSFNISSRIYSDRDRWRLRICRSEDRKRFTMLIGFRISRKAERLKKDDESRSGNARFATSFGRGSLCSRRILSPAT